MLATTLLTCINFDDGLHANFSGQGSQDQFINAADLLILEIVCPQFMIPPPFIYVIRDSNASVGMGSREYLGAGTCDPYGHDV